MPLNYQTFANDIKVRSRTYLIEEFGTYLIRSKIKSASPLVALSILTCLTFDAFNYIIRLYECLVLIAKYLCYRFLLFVGPANKTDIWVSIIKHTVLYISQSVVCHQKHPLATGGICLNLEWRGAIKLTGKIHSPFSKRSDVDLYVTGE